MSTFSTSENLELPEGVDAEFREYQIKGFGWLWFMYKYGLNGILADDMGLGKTLQALAVIQKAKETDGPQPTLVVCPTTVVFNWESEIQKFAPTLTTLKLSGVDRKSFFKEIPNYDVVITSYALLRRDIAKLKEYNFRYIILDESQNIKNAMSQTAQAVKKLQASHKLALSGTPIENKLEELWSVFDFLMPGFLFSVADFNSRYVYPIMERQDKIVEKRLKLQIYPFILRRMKRDVAKDLPDKVENIAYCELTDEQKDLFSKYADCVRVRKKNYSNQLSRTDLKRADYLYSPHFSDSVKSVVIRNFMIRIMSKILLNQANLKNLKLCLKKLLTRVTEYFYSANLSICLI